MTFENCKKLIEAKIKSKTLEDEYIKDMKQKIDIFLLNNRITENEYQELENLMISTKE